MATNPDLPGPGHRQDVADYVDRVTVVAEARVLVRQLDAYLQLMGDWIAEGMDGAEDA